MSPTPEDPPEGASGQLACHRTQRDDHDVARSARRPSRGRRSDSCAVWGRRLDPVDASHRPHQDPSAVVENVADVAHFGPIHGNEVLSFDASFDGPTATQPPTPAGLIKGAC